MAVDQSNPTPSRGERRRLKREAANVEQRELQTLMQGGLKALYTQAGQAALEQMLEEDADRITATARGRHAGAERRAYRHGYVQGPVVLGGRTVPIMRPRVRSHDGEVQLPTYRQAQDPAWLDDVALQSGIFGVSQRSYEAALKVFEGLPGDPPAGGNLSKSSVGRRFVAGTQTMVQTICERRLDSDRFLVLFLDGVQEGDHRVLAALGVTEGGEKRILGLWEGDEENTGVCSALLEDLCKRGLDVQRGLLVVIDGGKALAAATRQVLGKQVVVQRCRVHKQRNVMEKLPESKRTTVSRQMRDAWSLDTLSEAQAKLEALADGLYAGGYSEAAASLREGLRETLSVTKLGIQGRLSEQLNNTNAMESVFSIHEACSHRVKRWRGGKMVQRWVAAAALEAETSFHAIEDKEGLRQLGEALEHHAAVERARLQDAA